MASAKRSFVRLTVLAAVVGIVGVGLGAFRAGPAPEVGLRAELPAVGRATPIVVEAAEPKRGLSRVRVEVQQGDRTVPLENLVFTPRPAWAFWGPRVQQHAVEVEVGRDKLDWLREGQVKIRVIADRAPSWLRWPAPVVETIELPVKLRPPQLAVRSQYIFVNQGGCETVVYTVGDDAVRDGVQAGEWWFPGFPLPGGEANERFALFSAPWDLADREQIRLVAADVVGNEVRLPFLDKFNARPPTTDTIRLSDGFLERVVPAVMAQTPDLQDRGDPLENYLLINGELRRRNSETLQAYAERSQAEFLWRREFLPMRNAQVMSSFADRRTYLYDGRSVDEQTHLGFDLASTSRAEIQAANDGIVVLSEYFGIYGNALMIDHGYGLMSLYGHLSELSVKAGDRVERGQAIGRSGQTGLAGGDHLHFSMLLQGLPVNPQEWWDDHWIEDRLELKLGDALPFES